MDETQSQFIYTFVSDMLEEMAPKNQTESASSPNSESHALGSDGDQPHPPAKRVWCLPANGEADELASELAAQCLQMQGYLATALTRDAARERIQSEQKDSAQVALISAAVPSGAIGARKLLRQLRTQTPDMRLVVGIWNARGDMKKTRERLIVAGAQAVTTDLSEATEMLYPTTTASGIATV